MENKRGCIFSFKAAQKGDGVQIAKKKMGLRHASFHVCCASKQREEERRFTFWRSIPKKKQHREKHSQGAIREGIHCGTSTGTKHVLVTVPL